MLKVFSYFPAMSIQMLNRMFLQSQLVIMHFKIRKTAAAIFLIVHIDDHFRFAV